MRKLSQLFDLKVKTLLPSYFVHVYLRLLLFAISDMAVNGNKVPLDIEDTYSVFIVQRFV